jgi:hypothetical protein
MPGECGLDGGGVGSLFEEAFVVHAGRAGERAVTQRIALDRGNLSSVLAACG